MGKAPKVLLKRLIDDYNKEFEYSELPDLNTAQGRKRARQAFEDIMRRKEGANYASSKEYVKELREHNYLQKARELYSRLVTSNDLDEAERNFLSGALKHTNVRAELLREYPSKGQFADNFASTQTALNEGMVPQSQSLDHPGLTIRDLDLSPRVSQPKQSYIKRLNKKKPTTNSDGIPLENRDYYPEIDYEHAGDWIPVPNDLNNLSIQDSLRTFINQKRSDLLTERDRRVKANLPTQDLDAEEARLNTIQNKVQQGYHKSGDQEDWSKLTKDDYRYIALNNSRRATLGVDYRKRALADMQERVRKGQMTKQEMQGIIDYWNKHNLFLGNETFTNEQYKNLFK